MTVSRALVILLAAGACSRPAARGVGTPEPPTPAPRAGSTSASAATPADIRFMTDMHVHHAQAVLMSGWAVDSIHAAGPTVRALAERIIVGQQGEMALMERWLRAHGAPAPPGHHAMGMPGMLREDQLAQLQRARGPAFDRLFLTFMIHHHLGAITMVTSLLGTNGGAQNGRVYRFATDVHAEQLAEIDRMRRVLATLSPGDRAP